TAGYENDNYIATDRDVSADRNDDYWFIEPSVDVLITRWLSAGAYYLHREDISSDAFFSWYDNQVGVRATLRFQAGFEPFNRWDTRAVVCDCVRFVPGSRFPVGANNAGPSHVEARGWHF